MLDFTFHITTPRLIISHLNPSDDAHCDFICELIGRPDLIRLNGVDHGIKDRETGRKFIADGVEKIARTGYGRYLISLAPNPSIEPPAAGSTDLEAEVQAMVDNESGKDAEPSQSQSRDQSPGNLNTPIGVVTMQAFRFPCSPTIPDLGFGLLPAYHGRGYATEASVALVKYFEEERGQTAFVGYCSPSNVASRNVFRRLGWEERGVRKVYGILGEGEEKVLRAEVWTSGVGGEEELRGGGIGKVIQ